MTRFLRIEKLIGKEKLALLHKARVAVVGLGAVGSYVVEALARAGIGHLVLVDFDKVNVSNINRQLFALESTVGQNKADVAKARVLDINPQCKVEVHVKFLDTETRPVIFADKPDLVIDAIDSLGPKTGFLQYCYENNIPVISSMGAALRTDPLQIKTADLMDTRECPLAAQVRRRLRKAGVGKGIQVVYSTEPVDFDYDAAQPSVAASASVPAVNEMPAVSEVPAAADVFQRGRQRKVLGSLPTLTGMFGLILANLAIKKIARL